MKIPKKLNKKFVESEVIVFTFIYILLVYVLHFLIYSKLALIFYAVAIVIYIYFILPSSLNKKKSNLYFFLNYFKYKNRKLYIFNKDKYIDADTLYKEVNKQIRRKK